MGIDYHKFGKINILHAIIEIDGNREKVIYHKYKPDTVIDFTKSGILLYGTDLFTNKKKNEAFISVGYPFIESVDISLCRRNYGSISMFLANEYHIDLLIKFSNGSSFQIETQSWNNFLSMIDILKENRVDIKDPMNIYDHYSKEKHIYIEGLEKEFDDLADKHGLEHYRMHNKRTK